MVSIGFVVSILCPVATAFIFLAVNIYLSLSLYSISGFFIVLLDFEAVEAGSERFSIFI